MSDYADLIARLGSTTEGNWRLDARIVAVLGVTAPVGDPPPYTTSLDAALTLVPDGTSGPAPVCIGRLRNNRGFADVGALVNAEAATPALALCIAALRARAKA